MKHANVAIFVPHAGCRNRCVFCNQKRISGQSRPPTPEEVAGILREAKQSLGERTRSAQIAFFGGSFTAIPRKQMMDLLDAAAPFLGEGGFSGIRISTRPDAVEDDVLTLLGQKGVAAIELGAQSMDDEVLRRCGRGHSAGDTADAAGRIRERGFSLGLQMMTGLPGDSDAGAWETARKLAELKPDTVRIYPALVLEDTHLAELWGRGEYCSPSLDQAVDLCAGLLSFFVDRGISVIRLGLHDSPYLTRSVLAGPHHPAFRELCEGKALLDKVLHWLNENNPPPPNLLLRVGRGGVSKMAGQNRRNLIHLERMGWKIRIREEGEIPYLDVRPKIPETGKRW